MSIAAETPAKWWRPLARADRWALLFFVLVPAALFIIPALFGEPAIVADNLIQNFPLRVLAGQQIASGHLPLLDPLTNAGTPLLGGMNAGALYPLTVIFAFVPAIAAWIFNLIVVYVTAALGVFVLLRWHGLRTLPSFAAAMSYAYSGAMIGQVVHLGVVQGFSFLPWAAVLLLGLSLRLKRESENATWFELAVAALPWVCGIALLWGLTFLTGEPRAIADVELIMIVIAPSALLLRTSYWLSTWRARVTYVLAVGVGFAWGAGLGLVQLLPGWSFIHFSQRSEVSYWFFGAGSLAVRWSVLLIAPDIFGGSGIFGQQSFFANYNLAEVTGYAGLLSLMAAAAFLTRLTRRGWKGADRDFVLYLVIGVVGLFATWGSFTVFGHLFRAIPLFGSTRLQSRNVILVDFALAIVLGWWLQHIQNSAHDRPGLGGWSRWLTMAPAIFAAALSVALIGWGPEVTSHWGVSKAVSSMASGLKLTDAVYLVIALSGVAAVVFFRHSKRLFNVLLVILVVDLVVFSMFTETGIIGNKRPTEASRATTVSLLGTKGRFALIGNGGARTGVFRSLGEPNMNVFTGLDSVQGYGALISTIYDNATGTHPQATLDACHLADGTFTQLRLDAIAISGSNLATNTVTSKTVPRSCVSEETSPSVRRYFGQLLKVSSITIAGVANQPLSSGSFNVQLLNGKGQPEGLVLPEAKNSSASHVTVEFNQPRVAAGFVVTASAGVRLGDAVVATGNGGPSYRLDSTFQLAIATSSWRLTSTQEGFSVFKATKLLPPAWLTSPPANGRVSAIRGSSWGDTWVSVALTKSSVLERSEAYLPGWRATALNTTTGASVNLNVHRDGLVQSVDIPKGNWIVHFHYHAPYIELSVTSSVLSFVLLIAVSGGIVIQRRRRRNAKVLS
jgi:hypothetical protein